MKTVSADLDMFAGEGRQLFEWLGMFWTRIYENSELMRGLQDGQGLLAAQLYLDYLENMNLVGRHTAPAFHRERWKPIVIKRSMRDKGNANMLRLDMDPPVKIGKQPGGTPYVEGLKYKIGGHAEYTSATSYPLPEDVSDVLTCVCDNVAVPSTVLIRGTDFIIRDHTIFFLRDNDPFDNPAFPRRVYTDEGHDDEEILLWTVDTLIDKDYVYRHIGYVMGIETASSEFYQRMLNGLWDMYNKGTPISVVWSGIGAILGEPTIANASELVELVLSDDNGVQVVTDKRVYVVNKEAKLRASVKEGATLRSGEFLTETIRVYDTLNPRKLVASNEYGERLRSDVQTMFFGNNMLRARLLFGIGASWETSDIVNTGLDANGNPKLKFDLFGNDQDVSAFWEDMWSYVENKNISSETCFQDYIDVIVSPVVGAVYGRVSPLEYFMRYFLRANTTIVVVERDKLSSPAQDRDPVGLLTYMRGVLPAHMMLMIVEQRHPEPEKYDMSDVGENIDKTYATNLTSSAYAGTRSTSRMTYLDRPPVMRWVPQCV